MSLQDNVAGIGHNSSIKDRLSSLWAGLITRCNQLVAAAQTVPDRIDDEETATKAADLIKLMKAAAKEADSTRKSENEPYAAAKQQVDAFFNIPKESLQSSAQEVERRLSLWLQRKAAREEEQRRERADAERRASEERFAQAVEAESNAKAAQQSAALAALAQQAARADKEQCTTASRNARLRGQDASNRARVAKANADAVGYQAAMNEAALCDAEAKEMDARASQLRQLEKEADAKRKTDEAAAKEANKEVKQAIGDVQRSDAMVAKLDKRADASAAELSRSRGELGSVSSLRTDWVFDSLDRQKLDLETLRAHIPVDALEQAVRSFIRAGGRDLRGVKIFETTTAVVR